ncbi:hypothetical protein [Prauserella flavalba]|nr:hypothetical protein [Prauserella flavalba]
MPECASLAFGRVVSRVRDAPTAFYPSRFCCAVETLAAAALFAVA